MWVPPELPSQQGSSRQDLAHLGSPGLLFSPLCSIRPLECFIWGSRQTLPGVEGTDLHCSQVRVLDTMRTYVHMSAIPHPLDVDSSLMFVHLEAPGRRAWSPGDLVFCDYAVSISSAPGCEKTPIRNSTYNGYNHRVPGTGVAGSGDVAEQKVCGEWCPCTQYTGNQPVPALWGGAEIPCRVGALFAGMYIPCLGIFVVTQCMRYRGPRARSLLHPTLQSSQLRSFQGFCGFMVYIGDGRRADREQVRGTYVRSTCTCNVKAPGRFVVMATPANLWYLYQVGR